MMWFREPHHYAIEVLYREPEGDSAINEPAWSKTHLEALLYSYCKAQWSMSVINGMRLD